MHLSNTAAAWVFGNGRWVVRGLMAVWGILAVMALFFFIRRFWDPVTAFVASALYISLPINAIYINMANHESACIAWTLFALWAYLEVRKSGTSRLRPYVVLLAMICLAGVWDWPAYYFALFIALHWIWGIAGSLRRGEPWRTSFLQLCGFSAVVLTVFCAHFLLVKFSVGGLEELSATAGARRQVSPELWARHLRTVPALMFTTPLLLVSAAYGGWLLFQILRGQAKPHHLMPVSFAVGGTVHFFVFRASAAHHSFWAWYLLPFVALAVARTAVVLFRLPHLFSQRWGMGRRWLQPMGWAALALLFLPYVRHVSRVVPAGRSVGGSMWFVAPVRADVPEPYVTHRDALVLAEHLHRMTDRHTGVLVHRSMERLGLEYRWSTQLDRHLHSVTYFAARAPQSVENIHGWVFVGLKDVFSERVIRRWSKGFEVRLYGDYVVVDLRNRSGGMRVWDRVEGRQTPYHWFLVSPHGRPIRYVERSRS